MSKDSILFITTGGTIDSEKYSNLITPKIVKSHNPSQIEEKLDILGLKGEYYFIQICAKDSKDITDIDLTKIIQIILNSPDNNIIITHGTDTIVENAKIIQNRLQKLDVNNKKICFVGAFEPLDNGEITDGWGTLKNTVVNIKNIPVGVFVAIRSKFYQLDGLKKDFVAKQMIGTEIIF